MLRYSSGIYMYIYITPPLTQGTGMYRPRVPIVKDYTRRPWALRQASLRVSVISEPDHAKKASRLVVWHTENNSNTWTICVLCTRVCWETLSLSLWLLFSLLRNEYRMTELVLICLIHDCCKRYGIAGMMYHNMVGRRHVIHRLFVFYHPSSLIKGRA